MKQSKLNGAIALTAAQAVVLFLGYIVHPWIGRVLGPAQYGIYGIILSVQTIFGMLLTLGIPGAVSKFVAQNENHAQVILRQALKFQLIIGLVIMATVSLLASPISRLLHDQSLIPYLVFSSVVIFLQGFYPVYVQFLSGMQKFNKQALLTGVYAVGKLIAAISLLYIFRLYGALSGFAMGGIIAAIFGWYWTRNSGGKDHFVIPIKTFLSFAGMYAIILVGLQILMSQDLFMVKAILKNDVHAGYYNAATNIARISYMLLQGLSFVLLPSVAALTRPGVSKEKANHFIRDTLRYLIALIVPSITLAAATSRELITLFFSKEYVAAAPVLTILMLGLGTISFYLLLVNIVAGAGKPKVALGITILMIIVSAISGMVLIPLHGLMGAALQTTIAGTFGLIALATYTFKVFHIPYPVKSTLRIIIATSVMVAPTYIWKTSAHMLPVQYIVLGLLYVVTLWIIGEINKDDKKLFASLRTSLPL